MDPEDPSADIVSNFEYNPDDKMVRQIDPSGHQARHVYDNEGRLLETVDGNGNVIAYDYTNVSSGCASCGGGCSDQPAVIDFPTFTREIKYDSRGRKYAERDVLDNEDVHLTQYVYDLAGNLIYQTDAEGKLTQYEYDNLKRLSKVIDAEQGQTTTPTTTATTSLH